MAATVWMFDGTDATEDLSFLTSTTITGAASITSATDQKHTGPRSLKLSTGSPAGNAVAEFQSVLNDAGRRISGWFRFNSTPAAAGFFYRLNTSSNTICTVALDTARKLLLTPAGVTGVTGTTVLSVDTWYRISFCYTITSSTVWRFKVYINGTLELDLNSTGTLTRTVSARFDLGNGAGTGNNHDRWFDDIYMDDGSDYADPGDIRVTNKRPAANGTTNGFTTQIGSGGSGYGSGHAPQVNEQPLSVTNGWSMVGAGAAVTEEYNLEAASAGDVDISPFVLVDYMGWLFAKSSGSQTAQIKVGGSSSNISLTTTNTLFRKVAGAASYPAGGTDIGIITSTDLQTVSLYEGGVLFAYKMIAPGSGSISGGAAISGVGRATAAGQGAVSCSVTVAGEGRSTATTAGARTRKASAVCTAIWV